MKTTFDQLKQHKTGRNQEDFNKVLDRLLPGLKRYVRHRIRIFELKGLLPKNYYVTADVIADIYLKLYEKPDKIHSEKALRIEAFRLADEILQSYVAQHNKPYKKLNVNDLLKEELKMLDETFTVDADGDLVLIEELDDISYKQDEFKRKIYLFDKTAEEMFARALGLSAEDFKDEKFRAIFGNLYANLPETARQVLDLVSQGGLPPSEAAVVAGVKESDIIAVLNRVKKLLNK